MRKLYNAGRKPDSPRRAVAVHRTRARELTASRSVPGQPAAGHPRASGEPSRSGEPDRQHLPHAVPAMAALVGKANWWPSKPTDQRSVQAPA